MTFGDILVEVFSVGFGLPKFGELLPRNFIVYINTSVVKNDG
jgi:hypothetical protein